MISAKFENMFKISSVATVIFLLSLPADSFVAKLRNIEFGRAMVVMQSTKEVPSLAQT